MELHNQIMSKTQKGFKKISIQEILDTSFGEVEDTDFVKRTSELTERKCSFDLFSIVKETNET